MLILSRDNKTEFNFEKHIKLCNKILQSFFKLENYDFNY